MKDLADFFKGIFGHVPKILHVFLWAATAVLVLPCVFVAHVFYPMWEEWGKEL